MLICCYFIKRQQLTPTSCCYFCGELMTPFAFGLTRAPSAWPRTSDRLIGLTRGAHRAGSYQPPAATPARDATPKGATAQRAEPRSPGCRRAAWVLGAFQAVNLSG